MSLRTRTAVEALYLLLLAILIAAPLIPLLRWTVEAFGFRYGLDYNEGIVWKQMVEIMAGRGYAPIDGFPAIVFHYPPVFHLSAGALASTGIDPLLAGRLVSLISIAVTALIVGDLARRLLPPGRPMFAWAAFGSAIIQLFLYEAVHGFAVHMRVDAIACVLAFAGLWCIVLSDRRPWLVHLAALCFVLSVFSKQTSVVTAAAGFGALLLLRPRRAVRAITVTVALGAIILAALAWVTDGNALRHMFLYNINRFDMGRLIPNLLDGIGGDKALLLIGGFGYALVAAQVWRGRRRGAETSLVAAAMLLLVPLGTLSLVTTAKYGSSASYYMQWLAGFAIFGGFAFAWLLKASSEALDRRQWWRAAAWGVVPLALALQLRTYADSVHMLDLEARRNAFPQLVALLEPVQGDILSSEMSLLMRMGRDVVWEPAIFAELAHKGVWDEQLVIDRIRDGRVGAVLSAGERGYKWFDEQYNPRVAAAIEAALPRKERIGVWVVHLPAAVGASPIVDPVSGTPTVAAGQSRSAASASGTEPVPPSSAPSGRP